MSSASLKPVTTQSQSVGRPTKLTAATVTKLEQVFSMDGDVSEACFYAGISRNTYYRYIEENPELSDRFEQLRAAPVLQARRTIISALKYNPAIAMKYLERKRPEEFGPKAAVPVQPESMNVVIQDFINPDITKAIKKIYGREATDGKEL